MGIQGIENLFGDDFPQDHDTTDVPLVKVTHTDDGPGFVTTEDELPPGDFEGDDDDSSADQV